MDSIENIKVISTKTLLALLEIDDYKEFCEDLKNLIVSGKNSGEIINIYDMLQEKKTFVQKKYSRFIKKYKNTIDVLKKYDCLFTLTVFKYHSNGETSSFEFSDYFYDYILKHTEEKDKIKKLIEKINNLKIKSISYNEDADFTKKIFKINASGNKEFCYMENMDVKLSYDDYPIFYKSSDSSYLIYVDTIIGDVYMSSSISLNSLCIDSDRLPDRIDERNTFNYIKNISKNKKNERAIYRNVYDINKVIDSIEDSINRLKSLSDSCKDDKKQYQNIIDILTINLNKLYILRDEYDSKIVDYEKVKIRK